MLKRFWSEERGADATEYALLAALIAVAIVGGAQAMGGSLDNAFNSVAGSVSAASGLPAQ